VDKNGFLIAVMVTIANMHDSKAAYLLMRVLKEMCSGVKVILADGGYRGELVNNIKKEVRIFHRGAYAEISRST
jgi:transposase